MTVNRKRVRRLTARAQDLPVPLARPGDRPAEPGLGGRHHVYSDRPRLSGRLVFVPEVKVEFEFGLVSGTPCRSCKRLSLPCCTKWMCAEPASGRLSAGEA